MTDPRMRLIKLAATAKLLGYFERHYNPAGCFAGKLKGKLCEMRRTLDDLRMDEMDFSIAGTTVATICRKLVR